MATVIPKQVKQLKKSLLVNLSMLSTSICILTQSMLK